MSKNIPAKSARNVKKVYKEAEYEHFLELVKSEGKLPEHWEVLAEAIGVHPNTIYKWRKLPEFEEARIKGINRRLKAMETSGHDDWRQWESSLELLGVKKKEDLHTYVDNRQVTINVDEEVIGKYVSDAVEGRLKKLKEKK